jgi:hypothetical protein
MAKQQLQFTAIDVASLEAEQMAAFMAYLKAKAAFKASLQAIAPDGHNVVFTEKYGTLANPHGAMLKVALTKAATSKPQGKLSLGDWLDNRSGNGQAV